MLNYTNSVYNIEKPIFRNLALDGEAQIADGEISGISPLSKQLLSNLPCENWRQRRLENWLFFQKSLGQIDGIQLLEHSKYVSRITPFCCVMICDSVARREAIRMELIAHNIFPAILWPIDDAAGFPLPQEHKNLSETVLCLHCDMRYSNSDMAYVASMIKKANIRFNS